MAYDGEFLNQCSLLGLDFSVVRAIGVSGDGPNFCGHMLLAVGTAGNETYFHVAGVYSRPKYMTAAGYQRYLKESEKQELRSVSNTLPKPAGARDYLCQLMAKEWLWGVIPNNCVAFLEDIVQAGGAEWSSFSNCPTVKFTPTITVRINSFFIDMERSIYRYYGVTR